MIGGGDQEIGVLSEITELQDFENDNWNRGSVWRGHVEGVERTLELGK